jgi:hypothetical protein
MKADPQEPKQKGTKGLGDPRPKRKDVMDDLTKIAKPKP